MQVLSEGAAALLQMLPAGASKDSGVRGRWDTLLRQEEQQLELQQHLTSNSVSYAHPQMREVHLEGVGGS